MDGQLIAAIATLWLVLTGLAGGVIRYLVRELDERDATIERLNSETKEMAKAALAALQKIGGNGP